MRFENGKVVHEHVWSDQTSLLVQIGLLGPSTPAGHLDRTGQKLLAVANDLARKLPKFELVVASWSADSR
jgi:hypothetical protein